MAADFESLVIKVESGERPAGHQGVWTDMTAGIDTFTKSIVTPKIQIESARAIVSGVPTAFARANMFKTALDYYHGLDPGKVAPGSLNEYYVTLIDEWRGLIGLIATEYSHIHVTRINLSYTKGTDFSDTPNIYEPKGAFGNVLFERKPLWSLQEYDVLEHPKPFIDVIDYEGEIIGAVSPETLFFTAVSYDISKINYVACIDEHAKRLADPVKHEIESVKLLELYAYVEHILGNIDSLKEYYQGLPQVQRPNYSNVAYNLQEWKREIKAEIEKRGLDIDQASVPPVSVFQAPFDAIFGYSEELYGENGVIYTEMTGQAVRFDPKTLLLPNDAEIARLRFDNDVTKNPDLLKQLPVYVLKAEMKGSGDYAFFALPLSATGLWVFGRNIGALIGLNDSLTQNPSRLTAVFDESQKQGNLEVTLHLETNNHKSKDMKVAYTVKSDMAIKDLDIILWPNFYSEKWSRYFLYSEMPHNTNTARCPFMAIPFVGDSHDSMFRIIPKEKDSYEPFYIVRDGMPQKHDVVNTKIWVQSTQKVADKGYKYEIYECNRPFKGVKLVSANNKENGFLVVRYSIDDNPESTSRLPHLKTITDLHKVDLGIDFGSTNTSIAYFDPQNAADTEAHGISFVNQRVSLLAMKDIGVAQEKNVFFFQGGGLNSNSIKSTLALHDQLRLKDTQTVNELHQVLANEVEGGFPCFGRNLPLDYTRKNNIYLKFGTDQSSMTAHLINNLKWSEVEEDISHQTAFLRSLLLQIYGQLFDQGKVPVHLRWSYPSSFGANLITQYGGVWNNVVKNISPVFDTESNAPVDIKAANYQFAGGGGQVNPFANATPGAGQPVNPYGSPNPFGSQMGAVPYGGPNPFGTQQGAQQGASPFGAQQGTSPFGSQQQGDATFGGQQQASPFGTQQSASPFGTNNMFANGGQQQTPDLKPVKIDLDLQGQVIPADQPLTEAYAVANFIADKVNATNLVLCFDVGGSTTDISAMTQINGRKMIIKQNSIRFAAQRVSMATQKIQKVQQLLLSTCHQHNFKILGLNVGQNKYSPDTAPYYFDQVMDRLTTDGMLQSFYQNVQSNCSELMCVNLYVTGLIMYYAGQISRELITQIRNSSTLNQAGYRPQVVIKFAGKGSRLFEWIGEIPRMGPSYYQEMYLRGIGPDFGQLLAAYPDIDVKKDINDVKFEVSKGLAKPILGDAQQLYDATNNTAFEVLGEDNFEIVNAKGERITLGFDECVTPEFFHHIGSYFLCPTVGFDGQPKCTRFQEFAGAFYNYATQGYGLKMTVQDFINGFLQMDMNTYITGMPEYQNALRNVQKGKPFDFVAPMIILEGMKFYDDYLLKHLS